MKIKTLKNFLIILLLIVSCSKNENEDGTTKSISGHELTRDEIWSGNITLKGDIVIPSGFTLTIEAGTIIKVATTSPDWDEGFEEGIIDIYSSGNIIANGTENQVILITSADESPALGDWWGIGLTMDSSTDLQYCCIAYAETGLFIFSASSTSVVENTMFAYTDGIVDFGPSASFSYNTFINGEDGYARWVENYSANISYCVFDNNSLVDVVALDSYNNITIDHSNFIDNGWYNLYISPSFNPVDVVITADNCYGISTTLDNGAGTIEVNNPSASIILAAGCGFELSELPLKTTRLQKKTRDLRGFKNKEELIEHYYQKNLLYQW